MCFRELPLSILRYGVMCCGVMWCGVVWCGVVWCGVVSGAEAWCGAEGTVLERVCGVRRGKKKSGVMRKGEDL